MIKGDQRLKLIASPLPSMTGGTNLVFPFVTGVELQFLLMTMPLTAIKG